MRPMQPALSSKHRYTQKVTGNRPVCRKSQTREIIIQTEKENTPYLWRSK
jgi:hypothetical protein